MRLRNKKTGEIGELSGVNRIIVYEPEMLLCGNSILGEYDTLAKLNEEWEDYKPIEPLIKDEKTRKAVRAWAEANKIEDDEKVTYHGLYWKLCYSKVGEASIQFNVPLRIGDGLYTIEELCGSEEIEILEPTYTTIEEKAKLKEKE